MRAAVRKSCWKPRNRISENKPGALCTGRCLGVNPEDKSLAGKEYGEQQAGAVKIIDIQASAAAKIRALDEESARKIAKIKEEAALRAVTRASEDTERQDTEAQKASPGEGAASRRRRFPTINRRSCKPKPRKRSATRTKTPRIKSLTRKKRRRRRSRDTIRSHYEGLIAKHEGPIQVHARRRAGLKRRDV